MRSAFRNIPALILALLALLTAVIGLSLCLSAPGKEAALLSAEGDPDAEAAAFLNTLCSGDYAAASACVLGGLPAENAPTEEDAAKLYAAVRESWAWESAGETIVSGTNAVKNIRFSYLDVNSLTAGMNADVNTLLAQYVEAAGKASEVYNDDNSYREEVVLRAWNEALDARIAEAADHIVTVPMELELTYADSAWQVIGSDTLLRAMAGGL